MLLLERGGGAGVPPLSFVTQVETHERKNRYDHLGRKLGENRGGPRPMYNFPIGSCS